MDDLVGKFSKVYVIECASCGKIKAKNILKLNIVERSAFLEKSSPKRDVEGEKIE